MKIYLLLILSALIFFAVLNSGCETIVDLDLPEAEPRLVIESAFGPDTIFSIKISCSSGLNNQEDIKAVINATIEISENGLLIEQQPWHRWNGIYQSSFRPSEKNNYIIKVSAPGYKTVTAADAVPAEIKIDSVHTQFVSEDYFEKKYRVKIFFRDLPGEKNYYHLVVLGEFHYGTQIDYYNLPFETSDPSIKSGNYDDDFYDTDFLGDAVFNDQLFDGQSRELTIIVSDHEPRDIQTVRLSSVSKNLYEYLRTIRSQSNDDDFSLTEPVQIYSNVENGFGIFGGYSLDIYPVDF